MPNSLLGISGVEMAGSTGAMAETWHDAAVSALGECVERYCCAVQPENLVFASQLDLGDSALSIDDFELFADAQYEHPDFPFPRHTRDLEISWVRMTRLGDGDARFVPACLIYIPFTPMRDDGADMLALSVSSGQACHSDRDVAVLSGIYEVIERDAFMLTWIRRLTPVRLDISASDALQAWFDNYLGSSALTFDVFRLPSDIDIPTVLCVARGTTATGAFACVGAACRLSEVDAVKKAIIEAAQGAVWIRDLIRTKPDWRPTENYSNVRDFSDHVRLYGESEMLQHLDFLYEGPTEVVACDPPVDTAAALSIAVQRIQAVGLEPLVCDISTPELADLGLFVTRVLIPGSVQLTAVHGLPNFGARRYDTVPERLGFTAEIHREYNRIPHPFP
ncbi:MAG: YcaO-like family protein [Microthrixaceae bacterium]|nr:YcaO-like family protein [Microthrixaceae bacterium]